MKRIINYFNLKYNSNKIICIFLGAVIYQFLIYLQLINNPYQYNFYDLIISQFGYLNVFYLLSFLLLLLLYNICNNNNFYKYYYLRCRNKVNVYNMNILIICIMVIIFLLVLNLSAIVECVLHVSFENQWSSHFLYTMNGNVNLFFEKESVNFITNVLSPFDYIIYINIFITLYLIFLGSSFCAINAYVKNRALAFILEIIMIAINMIIDSGNGIISKLSFTYNIFFITTSYEQMQNGNYILYRLLYWLILILIVYALGIFFTKKTDYKFEEIV